MHIVGINTEVLNLTNHGACSCLQHLAIAIYIRTLLLPTRKYFPMGDEFPAAEPLTTKTLLSSNELNIHPLLLGSINRSIDQQFRIMITPKSLNLQLAFFMFSPLICCYSGLTKMSNSNLTGIYVSPLSLDLCSEFFTHLGRCIFKV